MLKNLLHKHLCILSNLLLHSNKNMLVRLSHLKYHLQLNIALSDLLPQDGGAAAVNNMSPKISKRCPIPRQMVSHISGSERIEICWSRFARCDTFAFSQCSFFLWYCHFFQPGAGLSFSFSQSHMQPYYTTLKATRERISLCVGGVCLAWQIPKPMFSLALSWTSFKWPQITGIIGR